MTSATRRQTFANLAREQFDLLVIGGGITGAGIARDAALRGLKVALLDKADFGAGDEQQVVQAHSRRPALPAARGARAGLRGGE